MAVNPKMVMIGLQAVGMGVKMLHKHLDAQHKKGHVTGGFAESAPDLRNPRQPVVSPPRRPPGARM